MANTYLVHTKYYATSLIKLSKITARRQQVAGRGGERWEGAGLRGGDANGFKAKYIYINEIQILRIISL